MGTSDYSDEFTRQAVHQNTAHGYPVREVLRRLGVSTHSLYKWMKLFGDPSPSKPGVDHEAKNRRLKRELEQMSKETGRQIKVDRFRRWSPAGDGRIEQAVALDVQMAIGVDHQATGGIVCLEQLKQQRSIAGGVLAVDEPMMSQNCSGRLPHPIVR